LWSRTLGLLASMTWNKQSSITQPSINLSLSHCTPGRKTDDANGDARKKATNPHEEAPVQGVRVDLLMILVAACRRANGRTRRRVRAGDFERRIGTRRSRAAVNRLPTRRQNQEASSVGRPASGAVRSTNLGAWISS
jgi:hypothetical protein